MCSPKIQTFSPITIQTNVGRPRYQPHPPVILDSRRKSPLSHPRPLSNLPMGPSSNAVLSKSKSAELESSNQNSPLLERHDPSSDICQSVHSITISLSCTILLLHHRVSLLKAPESTHLILQPISVLANRLTYEGIRKPSSSRRG